MAKQVKPLPKKASYTVFSFLVRGAFCYPDCNEGVKSEQPAADAGNGCDQVRLHLTRMRGVGWPVPQPKLFKQGIALSRTDS